MGEQHGPGVIVPEPESLQVIGGLTLRRNPKGDEITASVMAAVAKAAG